MKIGMKSQIQETRVSMRARLKIGGIMMKKMRKIMDTIG